MSDAGVIELVECFPGIADYRRLRELPGYGDEKARMALPTPVE